MRLPLAGLTVVTADAAALEPFTGILQDELNLKGITLVDLATTSAAEYGIESRLSINARVLGPRVGKDVQRVIQGAKAGNWSETDGVVTVDGIALEAGEYDLALEISGGQEGTAVALLPRGGFLLLDTVVTDELEAEGHARDLIRDIQQARRSAGLDVSDRIELHLVGDSDLLAVVAAHRELISSEVLAVALDAAESEGDDGVHLAKWPDSHVVVSASRSWGASNGGRLELRKTGPVTVDA